MLEDSHHLNNEQPLENQSAQNQTERYRTLNLLQDEIDALVQSLLPREANDDK